MFIHMYILRQGVHALSEYSYLQEICSSSVSLVLLKAILNLSKKKKKKKVAIPQYMCVTLSSYISIQNAYGGIFTTEFSNCCDFQTTETLS